MIEDSHDAATRDDITILAKRAGLELSPEHLEELVEAYRRLEPVLRTLRRDREPSIEPASSFDPRRFMPDAASDRSSGASTRGR